MTFAAERATRTHAFDLDIPKEEAFHLFEPEGERCWAPDWNPRYFSPRDGTAEAGMVFATGVGAAATIWVMSRHEPAAGRVEYVRTTPGSRVATVSVRCAALSPRRTRVEVTYVFTSLGDAGNEYIRAMSEEAFRKMIEGWKSAIDSRDTLPAAA